MTLLDSINIGGNTYGITGAAVLGASSTPAGSEVKVCTFTDGFELKAGNLFLIKFTYANTYGDGSTTYPKLQINGTNYVMRRADGNYVQSGEWDNNATLTFLFDGTDFILPAGSATGSASVPLGSVIAIYTNSVPDGYLPCNGVQFDPAQFAALYALLGDDHTPDLRECALVGIGENASDTIANHDVYTLGQFKDDQVQTHRHDVQVGANASLGAIDASLPTWPLSRYFNVDVGIHSSTHSQSVDATTILNGRAGDVTRGKRKGVNYIIKATSGLPDDQQDYILNQLAPVDAVTVDNMHSVTSNAVAAVFGRTPSVTNVSTSNFSGKVLAFPGGLKILCGLVSWQGDAGTSGFGSASVCYSIQSVPFPAAFNVSTIISAQASAFDTGTGVPGASIETLSVNSIDVCDYGYQGTTESPTREHKVYISVIGI